MKLNFDSYEFSGKTKDDPEVYESYLSTIADALVKGATKSIEVRLPNETDKARHKRMLEKWMVLRDIPSVRNTLLHNAFSQILDTKLWPFKNEDYVADAQQRLSIYLQKIAKKKFKDLRKTSNVETAGGGVIETILLSYIAFSVASYVTEFVVWALRRKVEESTTTKGKDKRVEPTFNPPPPVLPQLPPFNPPPPVLPQLPPLDYGTRDKAVVDASLVRLAILKHISIPENAKALEKVAKTPLEFQMMRLEYKETGKNILIINTKLDDDANKYKIDVKDLDIPETLKRKFQTTHINLNSKLLEQKIYDLPNSDFEGIDFVRDPIEKQVEWFKKLQETKKLDREGFTSYGGHVPRKNGEQELQISCFQSPSEEMDTLFGLKSSHTSFDEIKKTLANKLTFTTLIHEWRHLVDHLEGAETSKDVFAQKITYGYLNSPVEVAARKSELNFYLQQALLHNSIIKKALLKDVVDTERIFLHLSGYDPLFGGFTTGYDKVATEQFEEVVRNFAAEYKKRASPKEIAEANQPIWKPTPTLSSPSPAARESYKEAVRQAYNTKKKKKASQKDGVKDIRAALKKDIYRVARSSKKNAALIVKQFEKRIIDSKGANLKMSTATKWVRDARKS